MSFVKLHGSILDSSVWSLPHPTRIVWLTMLAMADENGIVAASVDGLARRAVVTIEECQAALAAFLGPDQMSRDGTTGERIERVPGGWLILNHANYRDRRTREQVQTAARVAAHRAKRRNQALPSVTAENVTPVTPHLPTSPSEAEAEADTEADQKQKQNRGRAARPDSVPEDLWQDFLALRTRKRAPLTATALKILAGQAEAAGWALADVIAECCARGWTGFRAEWVKDRGPARGQKPVRADNFQDHDYRQGGDWVQKL